MAAAFKFLGSEIWTELNEKMLYIAIRTILRITVRTYLNSPEEMPARRPILQVREW